MKEMFFNIIKSVVLLIVIAVIFFMNNFTTGTTITVPKGENPKLIIYGDNIDSTYNPYVDEDRIYLSSKTVGTFIDENIVYENDTGVLIITTEDALYKFNIKANIATKNLKPYNADSSVIYHNGLPYIDIGIIKEAYNVKSEYDTQTNTITVDKKDTSDLNINYNDVKVYSDIKTNSSIIETINTKNTVTVYVDSLKHNRWYKVKTDSGKVGYIEKAAVTVSDKTKDDDNVASQQTDKIISFWQYGSSLDTLGSKIDSVDVVMPTWFALSDDTGAVEINYNKDYYSKAKSSGYKLWPIITNGFDSKDLEYKDATSKVVNSEVSRETLIRNIVDIVEDYKLDGINIDFENMKDEDRYQYTQFLRELYPVMKSIGKTLSVDVYFTSYIDRQGVGKACDYLIFMGYDQRGNWSKEAGSIAEVSWEEEKINSLINDSKVNPSKIILGVPFYTRLWNIDSDGNISTNVYSMRNSQEFVQKYNLVPTFDEVSGQNYVETNVDGTDYKLWIEDAESISNRAELVNKYNLAGISAWQKGFETEDIWQVLSEKLK